jgi:hypothetical protein
MSTAPRGWFALFVTVVFSAGLGAGMLLRGVIEETPAVAAAPDTRAAPVPVVAQLADTLELTRDQQDALARIVDARRQRLLADRQRIEGRIALEVLGLLGEVDAILTPEQRVRFEPIVDRVRTRLSADGPDPAR